MLTVHSSEIYYAGQPDLYGLRNFMPIPDLQLPNADISVLSITSRLSYSSQVLDPWFRATLSNDSTLIDCNTGFVAVVTRDYSESWYYPDRLVSFLGCTEQYQFCNNTSCS